MNHALGLEMPFIRNVSLENEATAILSTRKVVISDYFEDTGNDSPGHHISSLVNTRDDA